MMSQPPPTNAPDDGEPVSPQVRKLTKINQALMQRVERSMDQQANAFSLFQTAIGLEAKIRHRTDELHNALSRLELANADLSRARDESERANRVKTRFFTAVGHDLLQPLHAARLTLSELADVQETPDAARLTGNIATALTTIEDLLTSILDLSKLEAGAFVPKLQPVGLGEVFEQLAVSSEPIARKKGLELRWKPTSLAIQSDPLMLRRMLQNLLANATRYTEQGGVLLAARRRGSNVSIEVWDTGPGIAATERERIFEEFQRGAAYERAGATGFGLGLSIVKRMSNALDHPLRLRSRIGRGSCFSIIAPGAEPPPAVAAKRIQTAASADLAGLPLIVIDNDLVVLEAMQTLLGRWGADVRLARDLDDISEVLADSTFKPSLILADYQLDHNVTGLEAVARIRQTVGADIPAVIITADRRESTATGAMRAGCELLYKPMRPAELRALMQHLLKQA
ncbi:MAG: hybrid sensor histidine kinase/response regulator [Hyphomicrobium sp.]|nr:hybrid sensor histidine kinase/response regulator [Hyphomicrobium sp.]